MVKGPTCPRHAPRPRPLLASTSTAWQTHLRRIQTPTAALLSCLHQSAHFTPPHHTKAQIPIAHSTGHAGSCMGGFRTQAPETLHHSRRSKLRGLRPKADVTQLGASTGSSGGVRRSVSSSILSLSGRRPILRDAHCRQIVDNGRNVLLRHGSLVDILHLGDRCLPLVR